MQFSFNFLGEIIGGETYISRPKEIEEITWMELHIAAPYLRIPEHLLDLLQKKETVPYFFNGNNRSSIFIKILSHVRRGKHGVYR